MSLEAAVHSMTGLVAEVFAMPDRGRLSEGAVADITVFDLSADVRPGGVHRSPSAGSQGVEHVFVGGVGRVEGRRGHGASCRGTVLVPWKPAIRSGALS